MYMFSHGRSGISLDGTWKFCPDPMQRCRRQKWWKGPPQPNSPRPSWDLEGLWEIQVPGTWKKQFPSLEWYDGHAVYLKDFDAPEIPAGHEAFLVFDGIVYAAEVYLNGAMLGSHDWGYSPFCVRVTETIQAKNRLFVLVDNLLSPQRVPGEIFDWNNDGGIINGVRLIVVPPVHVRNFRTRTRLIGDQVSIEFEVFLESRDTSAKEEITVCIPDLHLKVKTHAHAGSSACVEALIPRRDIELWCPENPRLYRTEIRTPHETLIDEIGYREIRTDGPQILLNGSPIRLYGVCVHSEFPDTGRTPTPQNIATLIEKARELGLNFLRCAHYPYAAIFGRAMDQAGILWWQEVPAYWLFPMHEPHMTKLACGMLEETIHRDWNRSSLIFWSISNECCYRNPENPREENYEYWRKAAALVRTLDPGRLLTAAESGNIVSSRGAWEPFLADDFPSSQPAANHRPMHADEIYQLFDVLAANLYVREPEEAAALYSRFVELFSRFNKPLLMSEFGSQSLRDCQISGDCLGSENRHAEFITQAYACFEQLPRIIGHSPWILMDGRAPIQWRWFNQGKGVYRYGLLDENWQPKKAYFALQESIRRLKSVDRTKPAATE